MFYLANEYKNIELTHQGRIWGKLLPENGWAPKIRSAQIGTRKKISKSRITSNDSICSKQLKLKEFQNFRPSLLALQRLSCRLGRNKNVSSTHAQNIWKVNKSWRQKRSSRNHITYIFLK